MSCEEMVEVFSFRIYDSVRDEIVKKPSKRTAEDIKLAGGQLIPGTGEMVLRSHLDAGNRYYKSRNNN